MRNYFRKAVIRSNFTLILTELSIDFDRIGAYNETVGAASRLLRQIY